MTQPVLLFYCQHSVGIGHLTRSFALAEALARHFHVVFANGGRLPAGMSAPANVERVDLPAIGMEDAHALVSRDAQTDLESARRTRRQQLLNLLERRTPAVLLIELFPFGRKKFAYELLPLIKAARSSAGSRPLVVSSLRDILVSGRPDQQHHDDRAAWLCDRYFDDVLVHADPKLARLDETFRPRRPLMTPVHYTGFVMPARNIAHQAQTRAATVLASAGGGQVGYPLLRAALDAHALLDPASRPLLNLIAGPFLPDTQWRELVQLVRNRGDVRLERMVPDLAARMRTAALSLSQCGYNTAMDILASGVPALVVPYGDGNEDEQANRARRLSELGLLRALDPRSLSPATLAEEILDTLAFRPSPNGLDLDGAERSAQLLIDRVCERSGGTRRGHQAA